MLELTPQRARYLARNSLNHETQLKMFAWLRADAGRRWKMRHGVDVRPADYGRHVHSFHQDLLGFSQCSGCELRLWDQAAA